MFSSCSSTPQCVRKCRYQTQKCLMWRGQTMVLSTCQKDTRRRLRTQRVRLKKRFWIYRSTVAHVIDCNNDEERSRGGEGGHRCPKEEGWVGKGCGKDAWWVSDEWHIESEVGVEGMKRFCWLKNCVYHGVLNFYVSKIKFTLLHTSRHIHSISVHPANSCV